MASQEKISVYNLADLKNTSDDAIPNYLNSLGFRQEHRLVDTRLALGYAAFAVAGAAFLWDYRLGFEATKYWTAAAVALYTLLNGALTFWIAFVEKGVVYEGVAPDGTKIQISTSTKKNVPIYNVQIALRPKSGKPQQTKTIELSKPFTAWFDAQGRFVAAPFQTLFATTVPAIGRADPKRVTSSSATAPSSSASASLPDFMSADADVLDALAASQSTGADKSPAGAGAGAGGSSGSKKSKRRKA
ncbi:microsomal signal peptidase 25 kDa subunit-domain-containing protein [Xylariomycetidae sp. FL2044]|nr:microsomal signal peptidase 25 kDa subunit-domain-containing protein [Xylariomycetidae sp. FL2044]